MNLTDPQDAIRYEQYILLARYLAECGVRIGVLEDLHAGTVPRSKTGDFSDVLVTTPYETIPWNELSRITDPEMRTLMLGIEARLADCCRTIMSFQRRGQWESFLQAIQTHAFGEWGISWDIPPDKWKQRQESQRRSQEKRTEPHNQG